jgi:hypothetical protein
MMLWAIDLDLRAPLREWSFPASCLARHWPAYYDYDTNKLYVHNQDSFIKYTRDQENGTIFHTEQNTTWVPLESAVPIQVVTNNGAQMWTGTMCMGITGSILQDIDDTLQNFLMALEQWEFSLLDEVNLHTDIFTAVNLLAQGKFLVATDGSSGDTDMSFEWKICMCKGDPIATHAGLAFGQASSFRAEGCRVLSAISFLHRLLEYTRKDEKLQFKLYLNNEGVITRVHNNKCIHMTIHLIH